MKTIAKFMLMPALLFSTTLSFAGNSATPAVRSVVRSEVQKALAGCTITITVKDDNGTTTTVKKYYKVCPL